MPETEIDVPEVIAIGAAVGRVADQLGVVAAELDGWSNMGQFAVDGSVFCVSELSSLPDIWSREVGDLAAAVREFGADLRQTAIDYRRYDELTAQQVRQIDDPTFGRGAHR